MITNGRSVDGAGVPAMAGLVVLLMVMLVAPLTDLHAQPATTMGPSKGHTVVFIDFEYVFTNYYKTRLANDQLLEMSDGINRERASMVGEYDRLQKEYESLREKLAVPDLDAAEADKVRLALDEALLNLKRLTERIEEFNKVQEARWIEQNRRIRGTLVEDIQKKLQGYMKSRGFLAVFDRSQVNDKNVPAVLYADEAVDMSGEFLMELNK